jgi:WD40 repeat protein
MIILLLAHQPPIHVAHAGHHACISLTLQTCTSPHQAASLARTTTITAPAPRLGADWTEKKSICNKFLQSSPVTCIAWAPERHNELVFGSADGKLKLGALKSNKAYTMYTHPGGSYVVSLACSPDGKAIVAGHADGSIYQYTFPEEEGTAGVQRLLATHPCVPHALCWGRSVAAAGSDSKVGAWPRCAPT